MSDQPRPPITIRPAREDEVPLVLQFVRELAEYERLSHEVVATEEGLRRDLFGPRPYAEVVFACLEGEPVGFALFFHNYSTFLGQPGIYLEDLFVRPAVRGKGVGQALLTWLAAEAVRRELRPAGVVGAGLERAGDPVLQEPGGAAHGRVGIFRLTGDALESGRAPARTEARNRRARDPRAILTARRLRPSACSSACATRGLRHGHRAPFRQRFDFLLRRRYTLDLLAVENRHQRVAGTGHAALDGAHRASADLRAASS